MSEYQKTIHYQQLQVKFLICYTYKLSQIINLTTREVTEALFWLRVAALLASVILIHGGVTHQIPDQLCVFFF